MRRLHIIVLLSPREPFETTEYRVHQLIAVWRSWGHDVVIVRGADRFVPGDVVLVHADRTVVPPEYLALAALYPIAINGRVGDISKRTISTQLVDDPRGFAGPVIVKTNRNAAGTPERGLKRGRRFRNTVMQRLPWTWTGRLTQNTYPIFPSPAAVPALVWRHPRLVVEKFVPEREGDLFALRQWVFFGDRGFTQRVLSHQPIVKGKNIVRREYDVGVPEELVRQRVRLGFDFGKFDFVLHDGKCILLDANKTPTSARKTPVERRGDLIDELARGLAAFVPDAVPR